MICNLINHLYLRSIGLANQLAFLRRPVEQEPIHTLGMSHFERLPTKVKYRILDWTVGRQAWPFFTVGSQMIATNAHTGIQETKVCHLDISPLAFKSLQRYINDDQLSGIRKAASLSKTCKKAVISWCQHARDIAFTLPKENFDVHFHNVAQMHQFIIGLSPSARSQITSITGSWEIDSGSHLEDSAVPEILGLVTRECINLHYLSFRVDLRSIDMYHLNGTALRRPGQHRRGWSSDAILGFKALGALKRTIEARNASYVNVFERRIRDAELQRLMAEE